MIDLNSLNHLQPNACPGCTGVEFEPTVRGYLHGSQGYTLTWLTCCRGCGAGWMAYARMDAVAAGQSPEWFQVEAERYVAARPRPDPPPPFRCPECQSGLNFAQEMECPDCGWLRYSTDSRQNWGQFGGCPHCGFAYRWDGTRCSHCGHSTTTSPNRGS